MTTQPLPLNWKFHHVGIAVWDIIAARDLYGKMGYDCSEIINEPALNVKLVLCRNSETVMIELIAPVNEKSPCMFYLKILGPGPYHTCYHCNNLEESLEQLNQAEITYKVVAKPTLPPDQPRLLFLFIPICGLIELIETKLDPRKDI